MRSFDAALLFFGALLAALLAVPSAASACGCCDGGGTRTLLGWSASGRSALVHHDVHAACEHLEGQEVWMVGAAAPARCFDFFGADPDAPVGCGFANQVSEYDAGVAGRVRRSPSRARFFAQRPRSIDPRHLVASVSPVSAPAAAMCGSTARLTVSLRDVPGPPLLTTELCLGAPDDVAGEMEDGEWMTNPIRVRAHPSPDGHAALLFVRGADASPGTGYFEETAHWVRLPAALHRPSALASLLTTAADVEVRALPSPRPRASPAVQRIANRDNAAALVAHRRGDYEAAASGFYRALWRDPGHVFARYNLACAEARLGHVGRAAEILRGFERWGCAACRERLERAARDVDLAAVVSRPDVRAWLPTPEP